MFIKFRYKKPEGDTSILIQEPVVYAVTEPGATSENYRFSSAVAEFGLLLRDSDYKGNADWGGLYSRAENSKGQDLFGYRQEFLTLVKKAEKFAGTVE